LRLPNYNFDGVHYLTEECETARSEDKNAPEVATAQREEKTKETAAADEQTKSSRRETPPRSHTPPHSHSFHCVVTASMRTAEKTAPD
jgi:hypothetical protein